MISIKSLTKTYKSNGRPVQALNGIDLEIDPACSACSAPTGRAKPP